MFVDFRGQTKTLADWAREFDVPRTTLWQRVARYNWTIEKAFTEPVRKPRMEAA